MAGIIATPFVNQIATIVATDGCITIAVGIATVTTTCPCANWCSPAQINMHRHKQLRQQSHSHGMGNRLTSAVKVISSGRSVCAPARRVARLNVTSARTARTVS